MIDLLKFYISDVQLLYNDKTIWEEPNSYHLVDASQNQSLTFSSNISSGVFFNQLKFNLGIDSATNVSGALGGDLDPTKGMYWTWQSGYINLKLEGRSNRCKKRNNEFQFHLGGYQFPDNSLQTLLLNVHSNDTIVVLMDVGLFLSGIDLSLQNRIMSPGKEAVLLSESLAKIFYVQKQ
jgi:hypothetical protein